MGGNPRREYLAAIRERYIEASREEKGIILRPVAHSLLWVLSQVQM